MTTVAVVGLAIGAKPASDRWAIAHWLAMWDRSAATSSRMALAEGRDENFSCLPQAPVPLTAKRRTMLIRKAEAEEGLAAKFEWACYCPWINIGPDLPGPAR